MISAGHHTMFIKKKPIEFYGTTILFKTNTNTRVMSIKNLVKAADSESIKIDWGDGSPIEVYTGNVNNISHTYQSNDFYLFNISDDVTSMGFKDSTNRKLIVCFLSFGQKITTFQGNCFQNYTIETNSSNTDWSGLTDEEHYNELVKWTTDIEVVIAATSLGSYSIFPFARNVRFSNLTSLTGAPFYAGGFSKTQNLTFDSPNITINGDYLYDWTSFMQGWRTRYDSKNLTFTNKTVAQIKAMSNYPWRATETTIPVYMHGLDGTIEFNT